MALEPTALFPEGGLIQGLYLKQGGEVFSYLLPGEALGGPAVLVRKADELVFSPGLQHPVDALDEGVPVRRGNMMKAAPVKDQVKAAVGVGKTGGVPRGELAGDPGLLAAFLGIVDGSGGDVDAGYLEALLGQEEGVVPCAAADVQGRPLFHLALPSQLHRDGGGPPLFPGDLLQGHLLVDPVPALLGYAVFRPAVSVHGNLSSEGLLPGRYPHTRRSSPSFSRWTPSRRGAWASLSTPSPATAGTAPLPPMIMGAMKAYTLSTRPRSNMEPSSSPPPSTSTWVIPLFPRRERSPSMSTRPSGAGGSTTSALGYFPPSLGRATASRALPGPWKTRAPRGVRPELSTTIRRGAFISLSCSSRAG